MKIIDLLNKIANGEEVPKKIKYKNKEYKYAEGVDYRDERGIYLLSSEPIDIAFLNDEVEILEEEKKIPEKLNIYNYDEYDIMCKVNEILDYLEYLKSEGE